MSRRGRARSAFSLFSFQDIITCVSGIIILITLLLAVDLSQRKQSSPAVDTAKLAEQLRQAIAQAGEETALLNFQIERGTGKHNLVLDFRPPKRDMNKTGSKNKSALSKPSCGPLPAKRKPPVNRMSGCRRKNLTARRTSTRLTRSKPQPHSWRRS